MGYHIWERTLGESFERRRMSLAFEPSRACSLPTADRKSCSNLIWSCVVRKVSRTARGLEHRSFRTGVADHLGFLRRSRLQWKSSCCVRLRQETVLAGAVEEVAVSTALRRSHTAVAEIPLAVSHSAALGRHIDWG